MTHRDVKPANVLFDESGNSYLSDFGIAIDGPDLGAVGDLRSAGSPLYASPEQARDGMATAASDQYALGVMLWELLAGRPPFHGDNVSTLFRRKFEQPVPPLREYRPDVPAPVGDVLQRATSVHPADRYPTMADFVLAWTDAVRRTEWAAVTLESADVGDAAGASMATLAKLGLGEVNPYKGLRPFDEADAASFFGREDDTEALTALVLEHGFSAVVGPSGSGKSSLVRAGLVPRLRAEGSLVVVVVPGADPVAQLLEALREVTIGDHPRRTLEEALAAAVPARGELVVVLDQFEELWTLADADERAEVLAALTAVDGHPGGRHHPRRLLRPAARRSADRAARAGGHLRPHPADTGRARTGDHRTRVEGGCAPRSRAGGGPRRRRQRPTGQPAPAAVHADRALRPPRRRHHDRRRLRGHGPARRGDDGAGGSRLRGRARPSTAAGCSPGSSRRARGSRTPAIAPG